MKILALDTSSKAASAAILEEGELLGEIYSSVGLTHSQTILPMTESLLAATRTALSEIGLFAVTAGPGSFTGLRIGLAAVKGMAFALDTPCLGVSTLESLAYNLLGTPGLICPVMDARCGQVYTALFAGGVDAAGGGTLHRLREDSAIPLEELFGWLEAEKKPVFLVGDGARLCYNRRKEAGGSVEHWQLAPPHLLHQRASSVALAARPAFLAGGGIPADGLVPTYLRLPQAERELLAKDSIKKG